MPSSKNNEEFSDFYLDNWLEKKQFNKKSSLNSNSNKYKCGSTYNKMYEKDRQQLGRIGLIDNVLTHVSNKYKTFLDKEGLLLQPLDQLSNEDVLIRNRNNMHYVSMNKKKRWLLPNLVEERVNQLKMYKEETESFDSHLGVINYGYSKIKNGCRGGMFLDSLSVTSTMPSQMYKKFLKTKNPSKPLNMPSIQALYFTNQNQHLFVRHRGNRHRKQKRKIILKNYFGRRREFKNGNRNRNSGIKRANETFLDLSQNVRRIEADQIVLPESKVEFKSWCAPKYSFKSKYFKSSERSLPLKYTYGSRFQKRTHRHRRKVRSGEDALCKRYEKHSKKAKEQRDLKRGFSENYQNKEFLVNRNCLKIENEPILATNDLIVDLADILQREITTKPKSLKSKSPELKLNESDNRLKIYIDPNDIDDFEAIKFKKAEIINETPAVSQFVEKMTILPLKLFRFFILDKISFDNSIYSEAKANPNIYLFNNFSQPGNVVINLENKIFNHDKSRAFLVLHYLPNQECSHGDSLEINYSLNTSFSFDDTKLESLPLITDIEALIDFVLDSLNFPLFPGSAITATTNYLNHIGHLSFMEQKRLCESILDYLIDSASQTEHSGHFDLVKESMCPICYDDLGSENNYLINISNCNHVACLNCWLNYIETSIVNLKTASSDNSTPNSKIRKQLVCIGHKCTTKLPIDFLLSFVPFNLIEKYVRFNMDIYLSVDKKEFIYCKNENCNQIIIIRDDDKYADKIVLVCKCGNTICRFCLDDAHFPALCSQAKLYHEDLKLKKSNEIDLSSDLYESQGKHCPQCDKYMEKNGGCNHMFCICGFHYCWFCLKEFSYSGHECSSKEAPIVTIESWNFLQNKKSKYFKINPLYNELIKAQRVKRHDLQSKLIVSYYWTDKKTNKICSSTIKSLNKGSLNSNYLNGLLKEETLVEKSKENRFMLNDKFCEIIKTEFNNALLNLNQLYFINEYLIILFNTKGKEKRKLVQNKYSFRANIFQSLQKSLNLANRLEIAYNEASNLDHFLTIRNLNQTFAIFINNLKHFTINNLNLYNEPTAQINDKSI